MLTPSLTQFIEENEIESPNRFGLSTDAVQCLRNLVLRANNARTIGETTLRSPAFENVSALALELARTALFAEAAIYALGIEPETLLLAIQSEEEIEKLLTSLKGRPIQ